MDEEDIDIPRHRRRGLEALSYLSGKWQPTLLVALDEQGPTGFNELQDVASGISGKVLSETLETLEAEELIERRVLSESPLRVEYALTKAGTDLVAVIDELTAWAGRHLDTVAPTVLVADPDRRITEMYESWLDDRYTVMCARDRAELEAAMLEEPDVALIAEFASINSLQVLDSASASCRTVLLIDGQPDTSILDLDCDGVLGRPLVRETVLETVEQQLSNRDEPFRSRERDVLGAKLELLEDTYSPEELDTDESYVEARERLETLEP